MDMFNGEILSYRVTEKLTAKAINEALEEAIQITSDCPYRRTFHSDQGWPYQMKGYSKKLKDQIEGPWYFSKYVPKGQLP